MLNNGCGLCVALCKNGNSTLFVRCESKDGDVVVKDCLTPYIVAWGVGEHSWEQGHYFMELKDALEYLYSDSL